MNAATVPRDNSAGRAGPALLALGFVVQPLSNGNSPDPRSTWLDQPGQGGPAHLTKLHRELTAAQIAREKQRRTRRSCGRRMPSGRRGDVSLGLARGVRPPPDLPARIGPVEFSMLGGMVAARRWEPARFRHFLLPTLSPTCMLTAGLPTGDPWQLSGDNEPNGENEPTTLAGCSITSATLTPTSPEPSSSQTAARAQQSATDRLVNAQKRIGWASNIVVPQSAPVRTNIARQGAEGSKVLPFQPARRGAPQHPVALAFPPVSADRRISVRLCSPFGRRLIRARGASIPDLKDLSFEPVIHTAATRDGAATSALLRRGGHASTSDMDPPRPCRGRRATVSRPQHDHRGRPVASVAVTTKSVRRLPQFAHRNRSSTSGTSPRPASTRACRSASR